MIVLPYSKPHEIYIGTKIGTLKKVITNKNDKEDKKKLHETRNLKNSQDVLSTSEITVMSWGNNEETELLLGHSDQKVRVYNLNTEQIAQTVSITNSKRPIVGLSRYDNAITTVTADGKLSIWHKKETEPQVLQLGSEITVARHSPDSSDILASAGKNNCLKLWDLKTQTVIFTAKNEPHDYLQLEVPVWESDLTFLPDDASVVATCSRYGFVRLYDHRVQRRPVLKVKVEDSTKVELALTRISNCYEKRTVIVGAGTGVMKLVDLRHSKKALNTYRDFQGAVVGIACDTEKPYIISVSLDRHLRVHHMHTKKCMYKVYLKSKPTCLLLKSGEVEIDVKEEIAENEENNSESDDDCFKGMPIIGIED